MKKSSKRTLSRMLAGVMLVSSVFNTTFVGAADSDVVAYVADAVDSTTSPAAAEVGKTYTADFTTVTAGDKVNGTKYADDTISVVSPTNSAYGHDAKHGLAVYDGDVIAVSVAGNAKVTLTLCAYGNGTEFTVVDASTGETLGTVAAKSADADASTVSFDYEGEATELDFVLSATGEGYLHSVTVVNAEESEESDLATPESGKTYTADFAGMGLNAYDSVNNEKFGDDTIKLESPSGKIAFHDGSHGLAIYDGDQIKVAVAGNADITFTLCKYGYGTEYVVTDASGTELGTVAGIADVDGSTATFSYSGDATTLTFTLKATGEGYLHSVVVKNEAAPVGEAENFELWLDDIATEVTGTDSDGNPTSTKSIDPGVISYKDSTIELIGNGDTKFTPAISAAKDYDFGVRVANAYKAGNRNANANDIQTIPQQGDGTAIVFTPAATGTFNTYLYTTSFLRVWDFDAKTGERYGYVDSDSGVPSYAFKAEAGHTYVLSTTGKTNNCAFAGFEYIIDEPITVDVTSRTDDGKYNYANVTVTLTDTALGTTVDIKPSTESVDLAKGHTYSISTDDGGAKAQINGADTYKAEDGSTIAISFTEIPDVTLTGKITGVDDPSVVKSITFKSMQSGVEYPATLAADGSYSVSIKPGDYETVAEAEGYSTIDHAAVVVGEENVNDVYFESTETDYTLYDLPTELANADTTLTFNNNSGKMKVNNSTSIAAQAGDSIVVPVDGHKKVTVAGWYSGTWNINGENSVTTSSSATAASPTTTSIYTKDGDTSVTINLTEEGKTNYLYWVKIEDVPEFKSEITVPGDCDTLNEAAALINAMERPEGEAGRVTINLEADFQEQVVFNAPYITINGNGHEINWYYGVGYKYYSMGSDGLYNEALYQDKYYAKETPGQMWGGTVIVRGDYFHAENVTFRNTFNYELTEKEKGDGLIPVNMPDRFTTDVGAYAAKERSNALLVEADYLECKNCKILSSQDTLGRNSNATTLTYFKDCVIGGNVDYICGAGGMLFDNCELQWKTYTDNKNNDKIGYITAARQNAERPYIFRNCTITTDNPEVTVSGQYGRTWQDHSTVYFVNCETNGTIKSDAWGEMSSGQYSTASFNEYNNTSNGVAFESNPEATYAGQQVTDETVIANLTTDNVIEAFLANWTPVYYEETVTPTGLWGDADQSGTLTANDAAAVLAYTLDATIAESEEYNFTACDVDGTKGISANDAAYILQKVLDGDFKFPVESDTDTEDPTTPDDDDDTPEDQTPVNVYVVGDSTGCDYVNTDLTYYYKRVGFGTELSNYFNSNVTVNNYALSGRSSKSFTTETSYQTLLDSLSNGDYLLIAFGHNDEKLEDATRGTTPGGDKDTEGTFKNSLYTNYILPAQEKGATPILVTPIVRRTASGTWSDSQLHKTNGGDYAQDIIDLGAELNLTVIDNTTATKELYDTLTPSETVYLHAWTNSKDSSVDNTHLNRYGAKYVAYLMTEAIKASDSGLADYVKSNTAPTKADLEVNPSYVEPSTDDPTDLTSKLWTTTSPYYGSVFGDIGGAGKLQKTETVTNDDGTTSTVTYDDVLATDSATGKPYYDISENADGSVHLRAGALDTDNATAITSVGKIASGSDGLAMYYTPVDAGTNFEISGTITVNGAAKNNQVAFGAIVSDMVRVDTYQAEKYTYVAASPINLAKDAPSATYARIDGTLNYGSATTSYDGLVGSTVNVSIKKVGNEYTVTYGDTAQTYTVDMSGTVYAGFFVSRCADITVSNIVFNNEVVE